MKGFSKTYILSGVAFVGLSATSAYAQDVAATSDDQANATSTDIIVTAQRRDTALSRTPLTVAVISGEQLAKAQLNTESDLRVAVPGLSIRAGTSSDQLNYSIRGNSQDAFSGTRPGVLPYFNEVQIGGSGGSSAFYDLQSVQVLKGPQGTLFGRSATGGAVLFSSAKPAYDFEGNASALVGDHGARKAEAMINVPLSGEDLLFRVAGFWSQRHGFQYNLFDNSREGDMERYGFRPSLTANFGPNVRNELVVDYYHAKGGSMVGVITGLLAPAAPGSPPFVPLQFLYAGTATLEARATGIATLQAFTGAPASAVTGFYDAYFADPRHPNTGLLGVLADQNARGPYVIDTNSRSFYQAKNTIVTNRTTIDLGDTLALKNLIGLTNINAVNAFESDGTPYDISGTGLKGTNDGYREKTTQFSNEVQLVGTNIGGKLDFILGYFYSAEKLISARDNRFFDIFFGGQTPNDDFILKNTTHAGFGQATYRLGESGFSVTAGLRYTSETIRKILLPGDNSYDPSGIAPAGFDYDQSRTYNRLSWQFGAQYQATPELFLYAVTRRAYKSGGFVGNSAPKVGFADIAGDAFRDERVTDVESGVKFAGRLGGMPASLNLAAYHQWIVNSQRTAYTFSAADGPAAVTVNVPQGRAYGLEIDGTVRPSSWLTLGGNFNYIHSRFLSLPVAANGQLQVFDQVPDTPRYTGSAYADIAVPVSDSLELTLHGDVYAQSKAFTFPRSTNNLGTTIDSYAIANFRVGVGSSDNAWTLTANVKNAFNRVYYVGGLPTGELYQVNVLIPGEPRTFTVEARFKF